jgi:CotH kinase protein/Lamin Tail Domain
MRLHLFLLLCSGSLFAQNDGDQLFAPGYVHEIRFESPQIAFYDLLVQNWINSGGGPIPYSVCDVRIDGNLVNSIGVRLKGGLSIFNLKKPFKIDFDRFVPDQSYDGMRKLNLQNADSDAAVIRDLLGYHIFREAGIKAPRAAYARVYINDNYVGAYIMVEQVDKEFLRNMYASDEGILYKHKELGVAVESGDNDLSQYNQMIAIANNLSGQAFATALEQIADIDNFLLFFLVENFIEARDNPIDVQVNFYLYLQPETGKLNWIPWDLNYSFYGGLNYPLLPTVGVNLLYRKMLQVPAFRERYLEMACHLLDYLFVDTTLHQFIDQNAQLVRPAVQNDTYYTFPFERFDQDILSIKELLTVRRQDFLNGLMAEGFTCPDFEAPAVPGDLVINEFMASNAAPGGIADPAGGFGDWIELYNNTDHAISLKNCYLSHDRSFLKHWRFADTASIGAGQYRVVWADRDLTEPGEHTDFKLDKSGGRILLTFGDGSILDSVSYGEQTTNVAAARLPNGTGDFVWQPATFAANNGVSSVHSLADNTHLAVFPNPTSTVLNLLFSDNIPVHVQLMDPLGRTCLEVHSTKPLVPLDVRQMPPGRYVVVATTAAARWVQSVVIVR